jgi:hypothetical protein
MLPVRQGGQGADLRQGIRIKVVASVFISSAIAGVVMP